MSPYFESYLTVGAFAALGAVLVLVMLGIASVLRPTKPTANKQMTYECGGDPVGLGGRPRASRGVRPGRDAHFHRSAGSRSGLRHSKGRPPVGVVQKFGVPK